MAKKQYPRAHPGPIPEPPPELERILCDLASPDDGTRASAVRQLCPCRGAAWGVPIFEHVLALRNDPSPVVRHAVEHDLEENRWWNEREEVRRLEGQRVRRELEQVKEEIAAAGAENEIPGPYSPAWCQPRRPRSRKQYYPVGRR